LHLVARGNRGQAVFTAQDDVDRFLALLDEAVGRLAWRCLAYCLMPNHYHVVVETPGTNVSTGMHRLNGSYAQWFNRRHGLSGHLFGDRFYSGRVDSTVHLLELARYVVLNPKRAGLCRHPRQWRWSSYRATVGIDVAPTFLSNDDLLAHFGTTRASARKTFAAFVCDALAAPRRPAA
jgi:putative transposase